MSFWVLERFYNICVAFNIWLLGLRCLHGILYCSNNLRWFRQWGLKIKEKFFIFRNKMSRRKLHRIIWFLQLHELACKNVVLNVHLVLQMSHNKVNWFLILNISSYGFLKSLCYYTKRHTCMFFSLYSWLHWNLCCAFFCICCRHFRFFCCGGSTTLEDFRKVRSSRQICFWRGGMLFLLLLLCRRWSYDSATRSGFVDCLVYSLVLNHVPDNGLLMKDVYI